MCKDGRLTAKLLEAGAYQGVLKGLLTLARGANGLETQFAGSLVDANIGAALSDFGWSGYAGRGGFDFSLRSTGFAPANSVGSLTGTASFDLQAGVINGVSIEEAMRRSLRRPIDVARDLAIGQTTFTRARAQFAVANGKATISGARIEGPGYRARRQWRDRHCGVRIAHADGGDPSRRRGRAYARRCAADDRCRWTLVGADRRRASRRRMNAARRRIDSDGRAA